MPHIEASDGAKIFYRTAGGQGPPLVLCHASFSTHMHWIGQEAALSEFCRPASWDYRGHGLSEAPDEPERYTLDQVVEDLDAVRKAAFGDEPAFIGGLSVGGIVGLSYALRYPERVRGLLLFNTGPGFKKPEALAQWNQMVEKAAAKMESVGMEEYLQGHRASAELLGLKPDSPLATQAREGILRSGVPGLTRFGRGVAGPVPNLVDRLGDVPHSALVLVGSEDPNFQRASEVMTAKLPKARRVELADAGHVVNLDQPEAWLREVRSFLGEF